MFQTLMQILSTTFRIELSELRLETYMGALIDLPIEAVEWACAQAVKHEPHFPVPLTLRQYARQYREVKLQRAEQHAAKLLPQWSATPDDVGLQAIREVLAMLGDDMSLKHEVYSGPSTEDPEARKALLWAQARQVLAEAKGGFDGDQGAF